eukprot:gene12310-12532_t
MKCAFLISLVMGSMVASAQADICDCAGPACSCCASISIHQIKFKEKVCANILAVAKSTTDIELDVNVTLNGKTEWAKTITDITDQELGCQKIPGIPFPISELKPEICEELGSVSDTGDEIKGCLDVKFKAAGDEIASAKLGCFDLKFKKAFEAFMEQ